jgi:hypothetical protein
MPRTARATRGWGPNRWAEAAEAAGAQGRSRCRWLAKSARAAQQGVHEPANVTTRKR